MDDLSGSVGQDEAGSFLRQSWQHPLPQHPKGPPAGTTDVQKSQWLQEDAAGGVWCQGGYQQ
jgi:hypothetical protein